jgi:hypothetical protein
MTQVIYVNKDFKFQNQYYIQSTFSSPTTTKFEYYIGGNKFTGTGTQLSIPKPLKNQDGTYTDQAVHKGVFPEPGDNGILGRGSADVIVKENEILVRAGKFKGSSLEPNVPPVGDSKRGFLQLSRFPLRKTKRPDKIITQLNEQTVLVNYLIEWTITNPENTQEKFTGTIYLYRLKNDLSTNSKNLTIGSNQTITGFTTNQIINDPTGYCEDAIPNYQLYISNAVINNCKCCKIKFINPVPTKN